MRFTVNYVHCPGKKNVVADALSGLLDPQTCSKSHHIPANKSNLAYLTGISSIVMPFSLSAEAIAKAQKSKKDLGEHLLNTGMNLQQIIIESHDMFRFVADNTVRKYLPAALQRTALNVVHGLSHTGGKVTAKTLAKKFY